MKKVKHSESIKKAQKLIDSLKKSHDMPNLKITNAQIDLFESSINQALIMKHDIMAMKVVLKKKIAEFEIEIEKIIDFNKTIKKRISKSKENVKEEVKDSKKKNKKAIQTKIS